MRLFPRFFVVAVLVTMAGPSYPEAANLWGKVTTPAPGEAQSIGSYEAGCLVGAVALPGQGPGYRIMHRARNRFYGHPVLVYFVETLAERAARQGLGVLLIGDLGQPRGGPALSGHRSHQTGLDVDIWFQQLENQQNAALGLAELEAHGPLSMLTSGGQSLNPRLWSDSRRALLKTVQAFAEVERVFVNPVIKRELCRRENHRAWLGKLRPWWGHDDHFHIRLACPPGNRMCVPQPHVPEGDGCDASLDWWFTEEARLSGGAAPLKERALPRTCARVLRR